MADDDNSRRINRLAKRAKELDDLIAKTAKIQKRIVEEIRLIGQRDKLVRQPASQTRRRKTRRRG